MRPSRPRRQLGRIMRLETVEPRLYLSNLPIADFRLDYVVEDQLHDEVQLTLADVDQLTGLDDVRDQYGFVGAGQTVAVIDSGIAYTHRALGGGFGPGSRVVGGFDFSRERDANPYDDGPFGSHGTHVAGIIGGEARLASGVAPGVDMVALRVFDDAGRGYFSWVEEALQWVHDNRDTFENPITTVNLSLGASWNSDTLPGWATLEEEFALLEADGIFVSVAAGNGFSGDKRPGLSYPAASPHVVPVASVDGNGQLSYFSQRNHRVIAAPGRSISSSVPDYVGDRNGVDDDYARYSGTSMAAPYVAGAAVLLREALEFAGSIDVTQDTIYNLMIDTADTVYDRVTGQSYHRLNLTQAIDAVMLTDDFGSSEAEAHQLGTITDTLSLSGVIDTRADQDWFQFTAAATGAVTIEAETTGQLASQWFSNSAALEVSENTLDVVSFDVVAGQTYALGLGSSEGIGRYTLQFNLASDITHTDWGTIDQATFSDYEIDADGQWFAMKARRDGLLTVEAFFAHADGDVDLELFDEANELLGESHAMTDGERIDVTVTAGRTYYLKAYTYGGGANEQVEFRLTNLVSQDGQDVQVLGTDGNDRFTFAAGTLHELTVNGVDYQFESAAVHSIALDGLAGANKVTLVGTDGDDMATLGFRTAELRGDGYLAGVANAEEIIVRGGGGANRLVIHDSVGNDLVVTTYRYGGMRSAGFAGHAVGFGTVEAFSNAGGTDVAKLFDSPWNDTFVAVPGYGSMESPGFRSRVHGFDSVHAYATAGGFDMARLYDSRGDDHFVATPQFGALFGAGFFSRAKGFEQVQAYATAGGSDTAFFYDSTGDDVFVRTEQHSAMFSNTFFNRAKFFEQIHADSSAGGDDQAYVFDSTGDDRLEASADRASLLSEISSAWLYGFERIRAEASQGGANRASVGSVDYLLELIGDWK